MPKEMTQEEAERRAHARIIAGQKVIARHSDEFDIIFHNELSKTKPKEKV